jgi:hypothetical protein
MLEGIASFLGSFRKMAPLSLLGVGIGSGVFLFANDGLSKTLGAAELIEQHRSIIGLIFIGSWAFLYAHLICWGGAQLVAATRSRRQRVIRESQLRNLTPEERHYLVPYALKSQTTQRFACDDGIAGGLEARGILFRSSKMFELDRIPYNIQPWACKYLQLHPELLESAEPPAPERRSHW